MLAFDQLEEDRTTTMHSVRVPEDLANLPQVTCPKLEILLSLVGGQVVIVMELSIHLLHLFHFSRELTER